jgi:hypothetical protein
MMQETLALSPVAAIWSRTARCLSQPRLIYDPTKGASEFFILEYRTPEKLHYDRNVVTSGLVIWHIAYDAAGHPSLLNGRYKNCAGKPVPVTNVYSHGAPDWRSGGNKAYTAADGEIMLKWLNGEDSGVHLKIAPHKPFDAVLDVSWFPPNTKELSGAPR